MFSITTVRLPLLLSSLSRSAWIFSDSPACGHRSFPFFLPQNNGRLGPRYGGGSLEVHMGWSKKTEL